MKKIKIFMFAFILAGMTVVSCSSDDNAGPAPTIEGKWNQEKTVVRINNGASTDIPYSGNQAGCEKDYVEFVTGGVFNEVIYFDPAGTVDCEVDMLPPGSWNKNDNILTISNQGDLTGVYEIVRLTNSELQIRMSGQASGVTTTTTIFLTKAN
jgi:hypothetical protein